MDSDSSESAESEGNQSNQNYQFNTKQTKEVEECVKKVLILIKNALIKDTKCRKEHIKPIRKETKKRKVNKDEVAKQIQRLCNAIKDISSTQAASVANALPSLRHCEVTPGTSRSKTQITAVKLRHNLENIAPRSSRNLNNHYETTKSVTSQINTELVVLGNARNCAVDPKTCASCKIDHGSPGNGITVGAGIPRTCVESEPGPSRSYLEPRTTESLAKVSMGVSGTSKSPLNIAESDTLRQNITLPSEMSKSLSNILRAFFKSAPVSSEIFAPKTSEKHVKETSNNRAVIHRETTESHSKALLGIIETVAAVSSLRSCPEIEVSKGLVRISDAAASDNLRIVKAVVPKVTCDSTNAVLGTTISLTQTAPEPLRNCTDVVVTETSDSFTKPVKEALKIHHRTVGKIHHGNCIKETPGTPETLTEKGKVYSTGPSKTIYQFYPESHKRNMETEVPEAPVRSSNAVVIDTSRSMKTVVPEISCDSTNSTLRTTKSRTQTAPEHPRNCTEWNHSTTGTTGSCIKVTPGTPETLVEADTAPLRRLSETKDEYSRRNTEIEVSEITTSCLDVRESGISMHSKTIDPDTSSYPTHTIPGTSKSDSNVVPSGTSSNKTAAIYPEMSGSDSEAVVYGILNKHGDNIPHKESNNSQICTKTEVKISKSDEINNNSTTKGKTEGNLKRNDTMSNNDDPKKGKIDHKCTLCSKLLENVDFAEHYQEQHGMHHEIKHNNENYEHKIHDLNRRLQNPIDTTKSNNEQRYKITAESKKRMAAALNEATKQSEAKSALVNVVSDKVEEPAEKKKRTATRSDSTPHDSVKQTNATIFKSDTTLKSDTNQNTVLDDFVIDLTDDIALAESKSPTHLIVEKRSPKPVDDDQILIDHQFVDLSDDTSLYEIPKKEEDTKSAEALLLENVKQERAANYHDVEVVSKILPTISNNKKSSDKKTHKTKRKSTDETKLKLAHQESLQKRNVCIETTRKATEIVGKFSINSTNNTSGSLSSARPGTDKKYPKVTKSGTPNNPTTTNASENTASRTALGFGTIGNRKELSTGALIPPIETVESSKGKSKKPAISINQHLTQTKQRIAQHDFSKRRNDKPHRKSPYGKPNKTLSSTNIISTDTIVTKISHNAPKVAMTNATTTRVTQKENEPISVGKNTSKETNTNQLNADKSSTGTIRTRDKPELSLKISKTTNLSKQQTNKTNSKSTEKHTLNTKNTNDSKTDFYPGLAIKTVDALKESLSNTTSVSMSLPNSTTITRVQSTQKANQTSVLNHTNASHSMPLSPTPDNLGLTPNITSQKLNSLAQNSLTRVSSSASVSLSSLQKIPERLQTKHLPGLTSINSNQRRPVSSTSQFCDIPRNTQNVTTNINHTPSTSVQSEPKQQSNTTARTNKSDFKTTTNTPRRKSVPAFDAHLYGKNTNTSGDIQSPQTQWYPPILLATIGDVNTSSSNVASRNANRRASANSNDAQQSFRWQWHTPVEPENERPERSTNVAQSVTLNNLSLSFSNPWESIHQTNSRTTINQRPNNQRRADARQQSTNPEVGWQNLINLRHQSILLQDQGLRLPQADRTWHTPVKRPTEN